MPNVPILGLPPGSVNSKVLGLDVFIDIFAQITIITYTLCLVKKSKPLDIVQ